MTAAKAPVSGKTSSRKSAIQQVRARREAQLAGMGLRITTHRLAVMAVMEAAHGAMSHAEVEAALPEPIDRVTLYRTLDSFVDAGWLAKSVGADRQNRFVLRQGEGADHHAHAHFQCDDCGRVYCLDAKAPRRVNVPSGFAVESVDLQLHGHCADCAPAVASRA